MVKPVSQNPGVKAVQIRFSDLKAQALADLKTILEKHKVGEVEETTAPASLVEEPLLVTVRIPHDPTKLEQQAAALHELAIGLKKRVFYKSEGEYVFISLGHKI